MLTDLPFEFGKKKIGREITVTYCIGNTLVLNRINSLHFCSKIQYFPLATQLDQTRHLLQDFQQKLLAHKALPSKGWPAFFRKTGHVTIVLLEQHRTVNSEWYTTICLPVVLQEIRKTNRRRRIILHHDNASSHTSA